MKFALAVLTLNVPLDEMVRRIPANISHWIQDRMGVREGMHEWLHGFCACQVDLDPGDEDLEASVA